MAAKSARFTQKNALIYYVLTSMEIFTRRWDLLSLAIFWILYKMDCIHFVHTISTALVHDRNLLINTAVSLSLITFR